MKSKEETAFQVPKKQHKVNVQPKTNPGPRTKKSGRDEEIWAPDFGCLIYLGHQSEVEGSSSVLSSERMTRCKSSQSPEYDQQRTEQVA